MLRDEGTRKGAGCVRNLEGQKKPDIYKRWQHGMSYLIITHFNS
jgi:hypothetical protein